MLNPKFLLDILARELTPIQQWIVDPSVSEVMVNPGGWVFVESAGIMTAKGQLLDENSIERALIAAGKYVKKNPLPNSKSAIVYAGIDDLRISGALAGVSPGGAFMSIRKHQDKSKRPMFSDLIAGAMMTNEQAETIRRLLVDERRNMGMVGGTGSGKTTLLNALVSCIAEHERLQIIEDSREIQVSAPNFVPMVVNPDFNITARDLIKLALRTRPDRLILGETRGDETYDLLRALNSGHPGSVFTMHADSPALALGALEMMFQMSLPEGASISESATRQFIARSVNVLVFISRTYRLVNGVNHVVRKVENICLIKGVKDGEYVLEDVA